MKKNVACTELIKAIKKQYADKIVTCRYFCPECNYSWDDEWDCYVDGQCPKCGITYTSFYTEKERKQTIRENQPNSIKFIKENKS
jgi:rubrerythrin